MVDMLPRLTISTSAASVASRLQRSVRRRANLSGFRLIRGHHAQRHAMGAKASTVREAHGGTTIVQPFLGTARLPRLGGALLASRDLSAYVLRSCSLGDLPQRAFRAAV